MITFLGLTFFLGCLSEADVTEDLSSRPWSHATTGVFLRIGCFCFDSFRGEVFLGFTLSVVVVNWVAKLN